jgi:hypothetical protein
LINFGGPEVIILNKFYSTTSIPEGFGKHTLMTMSNNSTAASPELRTTSLMRPRARDHYTSSTLIGGKGGTGPSSLHITLEGPMEYVNARWM